MTERQVAVVVVAAMSALVLVGFLAAVVDYFLHPDKWEWM